MFWSLELFGLLGAERITVARFVLGLEQLHSLWDAGTGGHDGIVGGDAPRSESPGLSLDHLGLVQFFNLE